MKEFFWLHDLSNFLIDSIQIQNILTEIAKKPTKISASSRTDTGVNAYRLPCTFKLEKRDDVSSKSIFFWNNK